MLKSTFVEAALTTAVIGPVSAGGMAEPVMEEAIIIETVEDTSGAAAYLPVIIYALLIAVASS